MKKIFLIITLLFVVSGCSTLKVNVDYDTEYDFTNQTKYAIVHSSKEGSNTLMNDRVKNAIRASLEKKSYREVSEKEAELVFVFHVNVQQMSDIRSDYQMVGYSGYGYGRGFGGYGRGYGTVMVERPSTYRWLEGSLVIDALNPKTNKIVWRGSANDELSRDSSTPDEKTKYINEVVSKVMQKFPKN
ncbi:MAG: DUF4136 domain-containing protein [Campylobacterota bacterium]|nr:DUF4136 domain-containing protein [Campylobacterota bacterium]